MLTLGRLNSRMSSARSGSGRRRVVRQDRMGANHGSRADPDTSQDTAIFDPGRVDDPSLSRQGHPRTCCDLTLEGHDSAKDQVDLVGSEQAAHFGLIADQGLDIEGRRELHPASFAANAISIADSVASMPVANEKRRP